MPETDPAPLATLEDWLRYLEHGHDVAIDLGLERVRSVWVALGAPHPGRQVVTVAGTNGKGSTVHALEALARAHGISVATTTSPHLQHFNERIRIDGAAVEDQKIVAAFKRIEAARCRACVSLTYFEAAILASLLVMAEAAPDLAILEVGLGGRLDAVNIIDADLMVITPIALDHQAWLGDDLETIGAEKAGILRAGRTCVLTDAAPPESVLERAAILASPVLRIGDAFAIQNGTYSGLHDAKISKLANHQVHPSALAGALAAFEGLGRVPEAAATQRALASLSVPGRMQRVDYNGQRFLLDVAHNPHAAEALGRRIANLGRIHLVFGAFADKDAGGMLAPLAEHLASTTLVPTPGARGAPAHVLSEVAQTLHLPRITAAESVASGLHQAARYAHADDWIVICGSFTVVGAALTVLGVQV